MAKTKERTLVLKRDCYNAEEMNCYRKKGFGVKRVRFNTRKSAGKAGKLLDSFVLNKPIVLTEVELELEHTENREDNTP